MELVSTLDGVRATGGVNEPPGGYNGTYVPDSLEELVDIIRIIAAIILPPLGVFLQVGIGKHFWINILLTILGFVPGVVHAVWVIAKK